MWAEAEQDKDLTTIGGRIRYARTVLGLTQQDVADALPDIPGRKKSRASIAQYEMGNPPGIDVIADLAVILNENPCYLAFGGEAAGLTPAPPGQRVPINAGGDEEQDQDGYAILPPHLLSELGAGLGRLALVRLEVDAPAFRVRKRDYLLVDAERVTIKPDGRLYAVHTSAGMALVRSEPSLSEKGPEHLQLTSGQGAHYRSDSDSVRVAGLLLASVRRQL